VSIKRLDLVNYCSSSVYIKLSVTNAFLCRYEDETLMTGSPDLLHILIASLDPAKLQELTWTVMHDSCIFFVEDTVVPLLCKFMFMEPQMQMLLG